MILQVREIGDASDDGARWPVPAVEDGGLPVLLEEGDGPPERVKSLPVTGVLEQEVLPGGAKTINSLRGISGVAYVTDSRLVVVVEKFTKGSTHVGFGVVGVAVALTATGISHARAAHRRKGKILVGQVRWQWAKVVAAAPGQNAHSSATLRTVCETRNGSETRTFRLDLTVPGTVPVLEVAQDWIHRAASWRLAHFPGREDGRDRLRELTAAPVLAPPQKGLLAAYTMPNFFYVSRASAYPKAPADFG